MKLLIVSPVPTDPPTAGNRTRIVNLLSALDTLGHDVIFAYAPYEHGSEDYTAMEKRLGNRLRVLQVRPHPFPSRFGNVKRKIYRALRRPEAHLWDVDEWFDDTLLQQLTNLQNENNFDVVLIEYVFLSKLASVFPKSVRTIIDTHDLFGDRHKHYLKNEMKPAWFATTKKREIRALKRANAIIAIQDEEAEYLKRCGLPEVFSIGDIPAEHLGPLPDPGGLQILFVGSANPVNIQGLEWFVESVFPEIRAAIPNCALAIAGPAGQAREWPEGVSILGRVNSLEPVYANATVVVNPVLFGTGLAVKTIEALSYGKSVVATVAGARGLGPLVGMLSIAQDHKTFARNVIELLQSREKRIKRSQKIVAAFGAWRQLQVKTLDAAIRGSQT